MRPTVIVTGAKKGGWPAWFFTRLAVWRAGGRAVRMTSAGAKIPLDFSAVILGGGADIDPVHYQESIVEELKKYRRFSIWKPYQLIWFALIWCLRLIFSVPSASQTIDKERDELELDLLSMAVEKGVPILGICRGAQLINVFFGGSLYQSLQEFYGEEPAMRTVFPRLPVQLEPVSKLRIFFGRDEILVNSLHHQSINRLGHGLKVTARSEKNIVEGIESVDKPIIGVQWHPEYLFFLKKQQRLFSFLVKSERTVI